MSSPAPKTKRARAWAQRLGAAALAAVLLAAGLAKAGDPAEFFRALESYRLFTVPAAVALAYFVPALELVVGAALLRPRWRRAGALAAAALLAAFLVLLAASWARGLDISCGCFGGETAESETNYPWLLARNLGLLALALTVLNLCRPASAETS